jgi:DNA-directed RNA polymerase specialized sigma24 family protein
VSAARAASVDLDRSAVHARADERAADQAAPSGPAAAIAAKAMPAALPLTLIERIDAHRERLFICAVQLLDEPRAAQQVVAETLDKALQSAKDGPAGEAADLERMLDRLLISLALVRLKAMPAPMAVGSRGKASSVDGPASLHDPFGPPSAARELEVEGGESGAEAQFARIAQVLASLPIEARVAVTLVVMQGRLLADAAFLLGTSEESCRFFLNHGRKLLRRALQRDLLTGDGEGRAAALLEKLTSGTTTLHDLRRSKKATIRA